MPVIPATWEAEINRIIFLGQPGAQKLQDPHLNGKKLGIRPSTAIIPAIAGSINTRITVQAGSKQKERPYLKNNPRKKDWL
jgi:hypothetical protein